MTTLPHNIDIHTYQVHDQDIKMVHIPKGSYQMGLGQYDDPIEIHLQSDYEIAQYPVTNALWSAVMGSPNPHSAFTGDHNPVENVSWDDICQDDGFLDSLNGIKSIAKLNAADGKQFRLPTETQWEYAARGGKFWQQFPYTYSGGNHLKEVGWYHANSHGSTQAVGLKKPNILGLYDMSGNVWEWCADTWTNERKLIPTDGSSFHGKTSSLRVVRGGSWYYDLDWICRVTYRNWYLTFNRFVNVGFRLSRY